MMTMKQLDVPVRQWVPDWLGMICIFFIILPVTMLNGSYTGSMLEVSSTLGTNTEDITMGYYAASAGMAIAYPIVPKVLDALSSKFLLLTDLSIQFLLSWVCARSQNIDLVIICSFFIGFLKGFLMLWFIRRATKIFSPKNVRSEFYSYFYPLVFAGGQVSMIVTAELAYHYNWQYMYYFMMMMLMASILIVIVCFRHNRPLKPIRLSELHIREMLVIATGLLMLMYVILGMFMEGFSMIATTLPVVLPLITAAGFDKVWYGIFMVLVVEMAQITPPVAFNLSIIQGITGYPMGYLCRVTLPFLFMMMAFTLMLALFPEIVLWFPNLVLGRG